MNTSNFRNYVWVAGTAALLAVAFAAFATGVSDMKSWSHPNGQVASISVSGEGEVISVPDVATVSMTVREVSKTVPEAQKLVEAKIAKVLAALSASGVEKKDIKTLSYTINPRYEVSPVICTNFGCPQGKSTVTGYEVAQYVTIKVRDIEIGRAHV